MAGGHRTGLPDVDALIEAHEVEQGKLNATIVVSQAESAVATARRSELVAQQLMVHRRLSAAKGLLTKAQKDGSAAKVIAARERRDRAYTEFLRVSDEVITEMRQINGAQLDNLGQTFDQMHRTWDASSAVTDALARPRPPRHTEPPTGGAW